MKNNLEDFISANRSEFDDKEPSEKSWTNIRERLFGKQHSGGLIFWRAAAILFMGLSGYLLYPKLSESQTDKITLNEFTDVETFYFREISDKVEMIENFKGVESALNGFTHDFNQLEAMYEVLKDEMKANPSQKVRDALVLNLLVRIDLLNKQLEKIENEEKSDEEGSKKEGTISI
ncbi:MAG: hypothetical protein OEU76_03660 [Cyclobacteriaceae bacterium]|nr:hypothetical protein [Cyclobacteriaceae bacterium]